MTNLDIYLFAGFLLLFVFLSWSWGRSVRGEMAEKISEEESSSKGFEVTSISSEIERVRQNYVGAARAHRLFPCGRRERLAIARGAKSRFSFFYKREGTAANQPPSEGA